MMLQLPPLPYGPSDLAPVISQETIEYHYGKHEQTYIDNVNKMIEGTPYAEMPLEQIIRVQQRLTGVEPHILFLLLLARRTKSTAREVGRSHRTTVGKPGKFPERV